MQWVRRSMERRRTGNDEAGFTLVELVVAMVITLVVMSALLGVFVESLSTISLAKQRQTATALSTQVMEQLRAMPYDSVTVSTGATPAAGDPNINYAVTPKTVKPVAVPGVEEELVVNSVSPRQQDRVVDRVTYDVRTYISKPPVTSGAQQSFGITVVTTWSSNVSKGAKTTVERSVVYSPSGCLSTALHPYSGPCQAYFTAHAGQTAAGISVSNPLDPTANIAGFDGTMIALGLPVLSSSMLLEQTTTASSAVATTDGSTTRGEIVTRSGGQRASTAVDTDPSSVPGQSESVSTQAQTSGPQALSGSAGTLRVTPSTADTGVAGSAVGAEPAQCAAGDADGTELTTGPEGSRRPCASAQVQPSGVAGQLTYELGGASMAVASVAAAPAPARASSAHLTTGNTSACPGASGIGCAHAGAYRALGNVVLGWLPAGGPAGFTGSWQVSGLQERALSERGVGARAPVYERGGTLQWWNGTGYSSLALTPGLDQEITTSVATWIGSGGLRIEVSSVVRVWPALVSSPSEPADCDTEACVASASASGGITGKTTYAVTLNGESVTSFVVDTDLGGLLAETAYKAAPGG